MSPAPKVTRRRSVPRIKSGTAYRWETQLAFQKTALPFVPQGTTFVVDWALPETQVTVSENHPSWRKHRKGNFLKDVGGEFFMQRRWTEGLKDLPSFHDSAPLTPHPPDFPVINRYGPILAGMPSSYGYPPYFSSSDTTLGAWGAKAIANVKPTNACVDMSTMLGEVLREGIPKLIGSSLWKDRTRELRKRGADEYLNYQFGWAPIAREIGSIAATIANADAIMRQYRRDSGRMVRRRFEFPTETSSSADVVADPADIVVQLGHSSLLKPGTGFGKLVRVRETTRRRWFAGAFTYYLPSGGNTLDGMAEQAAMARKLLGLSLTPDTVWNLAPWSWAVDWFSNAGDVISNMTSWQVDGLCLRYGYVMEHTLSRDTYTYVGPSILKSGHLPTSFSLCSETKVRKKASPFGFGLTWGGLSPTQLAIAAALGISKS